MSVVKANIGVLVMEGLGPRADTDFLLARDTCLALLKLGVPKTVSTLLDSKNTIFDLISAHALEDISAH